MLWAARSAQILGLGCSGLSVPTQGGATTETRPNADSWSDGLSGMAGILLSEETFQSVMDTVVSLVARSIPNVDGVSVSLVRHGRVETAAHSEPLIERLDERQYALGQGPCVNAIGSQARVYSPDLLTETRWRDFVQEAIREGFRSVLSLPLAPIDETIGALNLYCREARALEEGDQEETAQMFAKQAAITLANSREYTSAEVLNGQLRQALESRETIGQAKGILMARERCSPDQAFDLLRQKSQAANKKLRDVAQEIVDSVTRGPP